MRIGLGVRERRKMLRLWLLVVVRKSGALDE